MGGGGGGGINIPKITVPNKTPDIVKKAVNVAAAPVTVPLDYAAGQFNRNVKIPAGGSTGRTTRVTSRGSTFSPIAPTPAELGTSGGPVTPTTASGNLPSDYTMKSYGNINADPRALSALRNEALTPSSQSPWLKTQLQTIDLQKKQGMDEASKGAASDTASARASLMTHGGLSGGAAERLAMTGGHEAALARQNVGGGADMARLAAAQTAEQNRLNILQGLPAQEVAGLAPEEANRQYQAQLGQYNIGNKINELSQERLLKQQAYQDAMTKYAAGQTSNAIQNSGSGSIFG